MRLFFIACLVLAPASASALSTAGAEVTFNLAVNNTSGVMTVITAGTEVKTETTFDGTNDSGGTVGGTATTFVDGQANGLQIINADAISGIATADAEADLFGDFAFADASFDSDFLEFTSNSATLAAVWTLSYSLEAKSTLNLSSICCDFAGSSATVSFRDYGGSTTGFTEIASVSSIDGGAADTASASFMLTVQPGDVVRLRIVAEAKASAQAFPGLAAVPVSGALPLAALGVASLVGVARRRR